MKKFTPKPAKPNMEASMCEYMACHGVRPCTINPLKELCTLAIVGTVNEDCTTFTPAKESKWRCPKLEDHDEVVERAKHRYENVRHVEKSPIKLTPIVDPTLPQKYLKASPNTNGTTLIQLAVFVLWIIAVLVALNAK